MMRRSLVFACLAAASVAPGCITYIQGDVYKHPDWAAARGRLGKVVIAQLSRDLADILGPAEEEVTRSAGPREGDQPLTSAFVSGEGR